MASAGCWRKIVGEEKKFQEGVAAAREFIANNRPTSLIGRLADPEEVANMVTYVCFEQASVTTRAALRVGGVVVRAIP